MKIYIAGSITNDPNYKEHFKKVEEKIRKIGHVPLNPCKNLGFEYKEYIDMGLNELMKCDAIMMLNGWENSDGAKLERHYADTVGLSIQNESVLDYLVALKESKNTKEKTDKEKQVSLGVYCKGCKHAFITDRGNLLCEKFNVYLRLSYNGILDMMKCDECLNELRRNIANGTYDEQIKNTMIESENIA